MSKRAATTPLESAQEKRSKLDFSALEPAWARHCEEAVELALPLGSRQPVVLEVQDEDQDDTVEWAYCPASRDTALCLLKTLQLLEQEDSERHQALVATLVCDELREDAAHLEALFAGLCDDRIHSAADLGQFFQLLEYGEAEGLEPEDLARFMKKDDLACALYRQKCYWASGDYATQSPRASTSHSSSSDDDEESSEESVKSQ